MDRKEPKWKFALENLASCPICFEEYSRVYLPVTLQCGHSICKECVRKLKRSKDFIKCPIDKLNRKLGPLPLASDFLELIENIPEEVRLPVKRPDSIDQEVQCNYSDIMESWESQYNEIMRKNKQLEEYLLQLYQSFERLKKINKLV